MSDTMQEIGEIRAQVSGLERNYEGLRTEIGTVRSEVSDLRTSMHDGFSGILGKLDSKFDMAAKAADTRGSKIWPPITIAVTVLLALGGALYWPVWNNAAKHDAMIDAIRLQMVPRVEYQQNWADQAKTRDMLIQTQRELSYLQGQLHPLDRK